MKLATIALLLCITATCYAKQVVNVYAQSGEIPDSIVQSFEHKTGIKVNLSSYENNETMYAKLKANPNIGYDVINPSSYYLLRMRHEDMLEKLQNQKLPHRKNIDSFFLNRAYDPQNNYGVPHLWGITGIFYNTRYHKTPPNSWQDFWQSKYRHQLFMLNDPREVFSMALLSLGYSINDHNAQHIEQAYQKLLLLLPNIKLFGQDLLPSIIIDEDTTVGMIWNGDYMRAYNENSDIRFVVPKDGFVIWLDELSIPKNAPHQNNAYKFIDYVLNAKIAMQCSLNSGYSTANARAKKLLPVAIRNNPLLYPKPETLKRGQLQTDIDNDALALYKSLWEKLKLSA